MKRNTRDTGRYTDMLTSDKGFSILEILIGMAIFMFGMLGVAALQISSITSNAFAGNVTEATSLATSKIEELMNLSYDHPGNDDTSGDGNSNVQDANNNNIDEDDEGTVVDGILNFGLDHDCHSVIDAGCANDADNYVDNVGRNQNFTVYWNVAEELPLPNCKTINVIVKWNVKGEDLQISIDAVRAEVNT